MMKVMQYIFPLLIGAMIGYVTNWIAIRMLFRPFRQKYIGKIKVPFTPGLIPKERNRISKSISTTVGEYLLTDEILINELKSEKIINGLKKFIIDKIEYINRKGYTIEDIIKRFFEDKSEKFISMLKEKTNKSIITVVTDIELKSKLLENVNEITNSQVLNNSVNEIIGSGFEEQINKIAELISPTIINKLKEIANSEEIIMKVNDTIKKEIDKKLGGMGFLGMLGAGMVNSENISATVIEKINEFLNEEDTKHKVNNFIISYIIDYKDEKLEKLIPEDIKTGLYKKFNDVVDFGISSDKTINLIEGMVEKKSKDILNTKIEITDLIGMKIVEKAIEFYNKLVLKYAKKIIVSIDIVSIIEREINAFDIEYLEEILLKIAKKELSAITKLGALIGFILAGIMLLLK